jgi:HSP20 family protein
MITRIRSPFFDVFDNMFELEKGLRIPKTNVEKTETEYKVTIPVPGLSKDDLKLSVKEGILKIVFEKEGGSTFVSNFTKSYTIPDDVKDNDIEGKVENGVLTLTLPISKKKSLEKIISLN